MPPSLLGAITPSPAPTSVLRALQDTSGSTGVAWGEDSHGQPACPHAWAPQVSSLAGRAPETTPTRLQAGGRPSLLAESQAEQDSWRRCVPPPHLVLWPAALPAGRCALVAAPARLHSLLGADSG